MLFFVRLISLIHTMMSYMKDFDHLKIRMKDVVSATNNFDPTKVIGFGGFGRVYRGELSSRKGQITFAFKKLDRRLGQGNVEFWKEIMMLSKYKHQNLISLKHFCIEGDEMILVYEYASRGSLDRYLTDANTLTWIQRLKISVGAARGLYFLHDPKGTQQRVIHRDVKSANILLDDNWTAKVSDFGLSKVGPANQAHTYMVSHGVGTPGYCDPLYWEFGFLSKESDVYSFGVVLFEILCGRLCCEYRDFELTKILVPQWRRCYEDNRLDEIMLPGLKEQMDPGSLNIFSAIAYQCVKKAREERPTMAKIIKELEFSLKQQEIFENTPETESSQRERTRLTLNDAEDAKRGSTLSGSGFSVRGLFKWLGARGKNHVKNSEERVPRKLYQPFIEEDGKKHVKISEEPAPRKLNQPFIGARSHYLVDIYNDTFPTTAEQFFDLLLRDGSNFTNEYRSARKDTGLNVLETVQQAHDVPYGSCFEVHCCWCVETIGKSSCTIKVQMGVKFKKWCILQSKIKVAAFNEYKKEVELMLQVARSCINSTPPPQL
ncbi:putative protein kinase RLK-Pelle-CrRLK1L-1 family [Helianthus annuus]|nr:putative protein kinase RLK-Pelle-CrRLK1L-1 family [Helianthus annuus]